MPVKSASGSLVQFRYFPSNMTDSEKWLNKIPYPPKIYEGLDLNVNTKSDIILDGGAIEIDLPAGVEGTHYKLINCGSSGNDLTVNPA